VEPAPVTVIVPCEPLWEPTWLLMLPLLTVPPLWIVSVPVPNWPTIRDWAVASGVATTAPIPLGAVVSMMAFVPLFGGPRGFQF